MGNKCHGLDKNEVFYSLEFIKQCIIKGSLQVMMMIIVAAEKLHHCALDKETLKNYVFSHLN